MLIALISIRRVHVTEDVKKFGENGGGERLSGWGDLRIGGSASPLTETCRKYEVLPRGWAGGGAGKDAGKLLMEGDNEQVLLKFYRLRSVEWVITSVRDGNFHYSLKEFSGRSF